MSGKIEHKSVYIPPTVRLGALCGSTMSGKTYALVNTILPLLKHPDNIIVYCTTIDEQDLYKELFDRYKGKSNIILRKRWDENEFETKFKPQIKGAGHNVVILDDQTAEDLSKTGQLAKAGRHFNCSTFWLCQHYTELPQAVKLNLNQLHVFGNMPIGQIFSRNASIDKTMLKTAYTEVSKRPYSYLTVCLDPYLPDPILRVRLGIDEFPECEIPAMIRTHTSENMKVKRPVNIHTDSSNLVGGKLGFIRQSFTAPIVIPSTAKNREIRLRSLKLPSTVFNITTANNALRYNYDSTDYDVELTPGIYSASQIIESIRAQVYQNGHVYTDATTSTRQYYWDIDINLPTGKSFIVIRSAYAITVSFPSSTLYEVLGWAVDSEIGPTAGATLSPNACNIAQGVDQFYLHVDHCRSLLNASVSDILYTNSFSTAHAYESYPLASESEVFGELVSSVINSIEIRVTDVSNNVLNFLSDSDSNSEDAITISLVLEWEE